VGDETIRWEAGNAVFFDDTYAHHVWNKTGADRVVLLFDLWHPDLAPEERDAVTDMFDQVRPHLPRLSLPGLSLP
jgi:aspartate beta-hydroxylase